MDEGFCLYAKPSLVEGIARVLDFGGTLNVYNASASPEEADARATQSDWKRVGQDLATAIATFAEGHAGNARAE